MFLIFGLGTTSQIDSVLIEWPDDKVQILKDIKSNQVVTVKYESSLLPKSNRHEPARLFREATHSVHVSYKHVEEDKIDFNLQRTLPHKFSQSGPGICVGDINGDGLEDFIIGGSTNNTATCFIQRSDGTFTSASRKLKENQKMEDEGLLLFDADNDHDLDVYIVSGSLEDPDSTSYQDRLYKNDGKGNFARDVAALPRITASGSCVRAADFDSDGDLDLFVGGRVVPGKYPIPGESYLLKNESGKFSNVTQEVCSDLKLPGMVTDALWTDFDNDGKVDLMVVGEFMSVTFFKNEGSRFTKLTSTGIEQNIGWWNSITAGDYDRDGDTDYVAGNLGLNNNYQVTQEYPLWVYAKDFDGNGSIDPIMACYMRESMESDVKKLYPIHFWEEINSQSTKFRRKYSSYKQYGNATMETLFSADDLKGALMLLANHMESSYIENLGEGKFKMKNLPTPAQVAPINGMVTDDVNGDGNLDVIMVGNDYGNEVFTGRYDALTGLVLIGNGNGTFEVLPSAKSGFYVGGDAKALALLSSKDNQLFLATQNIDSLKIYSTPVMYKILKAQAMDSWAEFVYESGKKQRVEFYYGAGYLSQSSRSVKIPKEVKEIIVYDYKGQSRKMIP